MHRQRQHSVTKQMKVPGLERVPEKFSLFSPVTSLTPTKPPHRRKQSNDNYDDIQFYSQFCSAAQNAPGNLMQTTTSL